MQVFGPSGCEYSKNLYTPSRDNMDPPVLPGIHSGGEVEAGGDASGGVEDDILGRDAVGGIAIGGRRDGLGAVEAQDAGHLELKLGVGVHGGVGTEEPVDWEPDEQSG